MANPELSVAATVEPVLLADAKQHLRVKHTDEDSLIERQIRLAREYVESVSHRQLINATWILYLDSFPAIIYPPLPPLSSVTTLKYYNTDNTLTTLTENTDFTVDTKNEPARIEPEYGTSWPSTRDRFNAVQLTYVAGYGTAGTDCPEWAIQAIMLLVANWYETREPIIVGMVGSQVAMSVNALLQLDPIWKF
jgi:uncharacterized phiE125 gp8 family phage protein